MNLRNLVLHDFGWKLVSVILAALVWWRIDTLLVTNLRTTNAVANSTRTREFTLPVRVMTSARESRGFEVTPAQVVVTVGGGAATLQGLKPDQLQVYVDAATLSDAPTSQATVAVNMPDEVSLVKVTPRQVAVQRL
jgi:hypothetical protein